MSNKLRANRQDYLTALCRTVPYHVVEGVLEEPTEHAVGYRTLDGCVMYADIVGFTAMCERLATSGATGLSQLSTILDGLFELLLERAVFPFRGYVIEFGGDTIAAVFTGADSARRCLAAAISLQQIMYDEVGRLLGGARRELMLRIGAAAGTVHLPVLGDVVRRVVVCAGATPHRALRLQQMAQPDEIVVDQAMLDKLGPAAESWERAERCYVVHSLNSWPPRQPIEELGERVKTQVEEKIALLEPFVPQPLAQRMQTTPHGWRLEGELRDVALLFAEIAVPYDEDSYPAVGLKIARSLPRTLRKYGGFLSKASMSGRGHRALGLFGVSAPGENVAERALLSSLEIATRIKGLAGEGAPDVSIRIGVHYGRVYFGAIGSTHKHDIAAVGDAVNIAQRVAGMAGTFEVLATDDALRAVRERFQHSSRGPLHVKGRESPLKVHVVHSVSSSTAHYVRKRSHERYLAGRRHELVALEEAVDAALAGQSQLLGLCGEAGAGKSVMLSGLIDRWVDRGGAGVIGRCSYATQTIPLAPVLTMFSNYLGFSSADTGAYRRDRLRTLLNSFDMREGANELVALLQPVRRADGSTEALWDLADASARERAIAAVIHFVTRRLERGPVLYVLEDVHFADSLTLQLAARFATLPRDVPFLMVGTYRPAPMLEDLRRALDREILLGTLSVEQTADLARHELDAEQIAPELAAFLAERTQGNPAFLVDVVRFLNERGLIQIRAGKVSPAGPSLSSIEEAVPRSMAHVALARLDTLGEVERRLLRTASAIGKRFKRDLLERVSASELEPDLLESAIATLETQKVLTADHGEQPGFMFRDEVIRAVAYETIPESERRQVHRRIADVLERSPGADMQRTATALALHRERAGQHREAAAWYGRAVQMAATLAMDREVLDLIARWEQVLMELEPDELPPANQRARVALFKLVATARRGAPAAAIAVGRAISLDYSEQLDPASWGLVDYWLGEALIALGKPEKARARLSRAFEAATDDVLRSDAARQIASTFASAQDRASTATWLGRARETAGGDPYRVAQIELVQGHCSLYVGEVEEARAVFGAVRADAKERGDLVTASAATTDLARCALASCDFDTARERFEEALAFDRALGSWSKEAFDLLHLGQSLLWGGRLEDAMPPLEKSLIIARELGSATLECEAQTHLGAAIALTTDPDEGRAMCEEGYRRAVRSDLREVEIAADLHLLNMALLRQDHAAVEAGVERCAANEHHMSPPLYQRVFAQLSEKASSFLQQRPVEETRS